MIKTILAALVAVTFSLSVASTVRADDKAPAGDKKTEKTEKTEKKEKKEKKETKEEKAGGW